jgi:VWFA-related protein
VRFGRCGAGDRSRRAGTTAGALLLGLVPACLPGAASAATDPRDPPRETTLVEQTESRLVQLDVTVTGPREVASDLGLADFSLKVHGRRLEAFEVDRDCAPPGAGDPAAPYRARRPAVSYLLYFDQPHLTLPGRARALDLARDVVTRLMLDGSQAMVVSNAARLRVIEDFTDDPQRLLDALDRLENDRTQWDFYATEEESRVAQIVKTLNEDESVQRAVGTARLFQRDESSRTDKDLRRLSLTLARLSRLDSRKAVLYFADTMRQNPGEHYVSFFGHEMQRSTSALSDMSSAAFASGVVFDQLINEAAAQGIRFYPVYAQGLTTPFEFERTSATGMSRARGVPSNSRVRLRDAQNTLANMASETGGHVFLRGESAAKIADTVLEDFACLYTLSFDPAGFPEDSPLRVIVRLLRDDVQLETRGRIVIPSASSRLTSRLLSAFTEGGEDETDFGLRAGLVPTGFDRGAYVVLLQVSVPGTRIAAARWELGATLIHRDRVVDEVSGTLALGRGGLPLILEREIAIRPGLHEVVAVAHEATTGYVLSEHLQVVWPDPNRQPVTCGPVALLQPTAGAFLRAGVTRTVGSLARSHAESLSAALPTALMGLVCRNRHRQGPLRVERTLTGSSAVDFPRLEFELDRERCAQVRDLIPAGMLHPGSYRYEMRVMRDDAVLHEASRDFVVVAPES